MYCVFVTISIDLSIFARGVLCELIVNSFPFFHVGLYLYIVFLCFSFCTTSTTAVPLIVRIYLGGFCVCASKCVRIYSIITFLLTSSFAFEMTLVNKCPVAVFLVFMYEEGRSWKKLVMAFFFL